MFFFTKATWHQRLVLFGSDHVYGLTVLLLILNFGVLVCTLLLLVQQLRSVVAVRRLRYSANGVDVLAPALTPGKQFHCFLSHNWGTGQDQVRIIKQRLLEMVVGLRVFLEYAHRRPIRR